MSRRVLRSLVGMLIIGALGVALAPVTGSPAAAQQEVVDSNGCYWTWNGTTYTAVRCPQPDGSQYYYQPDGRGGWVLFTECSVTPAFTACRFANTGVYYEAYPDGSQYVEGADRTYAILFPDGTVAEAGTYDANGGQHPTTRMPTRPQSQAMERRSQMYWVVYSIVVGNIIGSNPTAFDGLVMMGQGVDAYANCLHLNDSRTDYDRDYVTGFNELAEYCAR